MEASSGAGATQTPSPTPAASPIATPAASPIATPAAEPTATATATAGAANVQIACIFFDGLVYLTESDEYVEVVNLGDLAQNLGDWRLLDFADDGPEFIFPSWAIGPGDVVRVYTNEIHAEWGGFSFGRGSSIWNNDDPDEARLYNDDGELVSMKSYPPGCD